MRCVDRACARALQSEIDVEHEGIALEAVDGSPYRDLPAVAEMKALITEAVLLASTKLFEFAGTRSTLTEHTPTALMLCQDAYAE